MIVLFIWTQSFVSFHWGWTLWWVEPFCKVCLSAESEFCPSNEIKLFLVILGRSHIHKMPSSFHPSIYLSISLPSIHPSTFLFPFLSSPFSHYFFTQYCVLITAVIANSLLCSRTHAYAFSVPCCCKSLWQYYIIHVCVRACECVQACVHVCEGPGEEDMER